MGEDGVIAVLLALILTATTASAHVPPVAGKLVDCIQRSEIVVIARIERVTEADARHTEIAAKVERTILGDVPETAIAFQRTGRLVARQRYALFLRRTNGALVSVEPDGVFFPSASTDDALYARVVTDVRAALAEKTVVQVDRLRSALILALRATPRELRINAALELGALAHHGALSAEHRRQLEAIAAEPTTDATLRKMIEVIVGEKAM